MVKKIMQKHSRTLFILGIIILIAAVGLGTAYMVKQRIGDVRPAFLPPPSQPRADASAPAHGKSLPFGLAVPEGYRIGLFADGVSGARDITFSPGGAMIVSQTPQGSVSALSDQDGDGYAERKTVILSGLRNPHGVAFHGGKLYVADETAVKR